MEYQYEWYHLMKFDFDEDSGCPIEDEYGNISAKISICVRDDRSIYIDIMNNDCTYHNSGSELEFIENTLFDLIQANLVEKVSD